MSSVTSSHPPITSIDPNWTVSELIARADVTLRVLHQAGIDACCGGELSLTEAARRHNVELRTLLEQLRAVLTIAS